MHKAKSVQIYLWNPTSLGNSIWNIVKVIISCTKTTNIVQVIPYDRTTNIVIVKLYDKTTNIVKVMSYYIPKRIVNYDDRKSTMQQMNNQNLNKTKSFASFIHNPKIELPSRLLSRKRRPTYNSFVNDNNYVCSYIISLFHCRVFNSILEYYTVCPLEVTKYVSLI